jgi:TP901 family phage tail tape measure protein
MSLKIDRVQLEIVINNDQARKSLRALDDEARLLTKEMRKLKEGTEEYAQKSARLKAIKVQQDAIYQSIGITNMTMKELTRRQSELNGVLMHLRPGTEEYKKLKAEVTAISGRIGELKGKAQETGFSIKGMADGFNRYFAMTTAFAASIAGVVLGFKKLREDVAHLDDVYSDVMKTTGMVRDAVVELNDEFKKIDTRTSRESLNMLARDAGKLGINGRKDILDFVDAGNQINVALGEDLGDDAIKNIGKMVGVYKDASSELQNLNLKEQMLSVGSAVNQLGASSTASEPFLVSFAGRLGGIAKQAGISMSAILGFGSALDQDMQAVEMSATAIQNFIMKIMGDPAKFAKIAGLEVNSFTKLLSTDANAAIKQVLSAMNEKGGFQDLIPMFNEMGLEGARAVGVLSSLAGSIDKVNVAQEIANRAMIEGTSITDEYNIKNNNQAAQIEKARKAFQEQALIMGEKLAPAFAFSTNSLTYLIKALVAAPQFIRENQILIISLAGALLAWRAAQLKSIATTIMQHVTLQAGIGLRIKDAILLQAMIIKEEMHAAMIGKTTIAQKAAAVASVTLRNAMALIGGPIGMVILGITGLIAAIKLYDKYNAESMRLEAVKAERLKGIAVANDTLTSSYNAQQSNFSKLNTFSRTRIQLLAEETEATLKQAEAELINAKAKQELTRQENTRVGLWDKFKAMLAYGVSPAVASSILVIKAAENGAEAASEFDEGINNLSESIKNLRTQSMSMKEIMEAEANADKLASKTKAELEEKARLYGVALRGLVIDSEDYKRVNDKLIATNKALNTTTDDNILGAGEAKTAYEKLGEAIGKTKKELEAFVTTGDYVKAQAKGIALAQLEAQKSVIDGIIKSGGNVSKYLEDLTDDQAALLEEQAEDALRAKQFYADTKSIGDAWFEEQERLRDEALQAQLNRSEAEIEAAKRVANEKLQLEEDWEKARLAIAETVASAGVQIYKNNISARFDREMHSINKQRDAELSNKNLTEEQKEAIRVKYAAKEAKLKEDQFKKQKAADIVQALINGALAVTRALAAPPGWPLNAPFVISAGIASAAQTAVIAAQKVPQFAKGKYDVIGAEDGRRYQADWTGKPETRIYSKPSLVAEQGAELIVDASTTKNLMMNYPGIIEAIYAARVPQRSTGNLSDVSQIASADPAFLNAVNRLNDNLEKGVRGKWFLYDLEDAQDKLSKIKSNSTL